jgi:hypothetical protein
MKYMQTMSWTATLSLLQVTMELMKLTQIYLNRPFMSPTGQFSNPVCIYLEQFTRICNVSSAGPSHGYSSCSSCLSRLCVVVVLESVYMGHWHVLFFMLWAIYSCKQLLLSIDFHNTFDTALSSYVLYNQQCKSL